MSSIGPPTPDDLAQDADWPSTNRRRGVLVDKEIDGTITVDEAAELARLQAHADCYLEKVSPRPTHVLEELETHMSSIGPPTPDDLSRDAASDLRECAKVPPSQWGDGSFVRLTLESWIRRAVAAEAELLAWRAEKKEP